MDDHVRLFNKMWIVILSFLLVLLLCTPPATAMRNPAAAYCAALGYNSTTKTGSDGSMTSYCIFPGNQEVDAWKFLQGEVAPEFSYCAKQGYQIQTVNDPKTCAVFMTNSCAVCVLPDGSKTEVTKLMNLDLRETICSNGKCCDPKAAGTCSFSPAPPGGMFPYVVILVIIVGIACAVLFLRFRKKRAVKPEDK